MPRGRRRIDPVRPEDTRVVRAESLGVGSIVMLGQKKDKPHVVTSRERGKKFAADKRTRLRDHDRLAIGVAGEHGVVAARVLHMHVNSRVVVPQED